jgi:hypothetical protein
MTNNSQLGISGKLVVVLSGPDGEEIARCETNNLVTSVGAQYYAGRAALSTGLPAQVTGMKLGTGSTAVSSSGAGAALVTYLAGSNVALDATYPSAAGGVVTWRSTWAAGVATSGTPITEIVLVTETISSDTTSTAAETIARALLTGITSKAADQTLTATWTHTLMGV